MKGLNDHFKNFFEDSPETKKSEIAKELERSKQEYYSLIEDITREIMDLSDRGEGFKEEQLVLKQLYDDLDKLESAVIKKPGIFNTITTSFSQIPWSQFLSPVGKKIANFSRAALVSAKLRGNLNDFFSTSAVSNNPELVSQDTEISSTPPSLAGTENIFQFYDRDRSSLDYQMRKRYSGERFGSRSRGEVVHVPKQNKDNQATLTNLDENLIINNFQSKVIKDNKNLFTQELIVDTPISSNYQFRLPPAKDDLSVNNSGLSQDKSFSLKIQENLNIFREIPKIEKQSLSLPQNSHEKEILIEKIQFKSQLLKEFQADGFFVDDKIRENYATTYNNIITQYLDTYTSILDFEKDRENGRIAQDLNSFKLSLIQDAVVGSFYSKSSNIPGFAKFLIRQWDLHVLPDKQKITPELQHVIELIRLYSQSPTSSNLRTITSLPSSYLRAIAKKLHFAKITQKKSDTLETESVDFNNPEKLAAQLNGLDSHVVYNNFTPSEQESVTQYLLDTITSDRPLTNLQLLAKHNALGKEDFLGGDKSKMTLQDTSHLNEYDEDISPEMLDGNLKHLDYPRRNDFEAQQMYQDKYELLDFVLKDMRRSDYFVDKGTADLAIEQVYSTLVAYLNSYTSLNQFETDYESGFLAQKIEDIKTGVLHSINKQNPPVLKIQEAVSSTPRYRSLVYKEKLIPRLKQKYDLITSLLLNHLDYPNIENLSDGQISVIQDAINNSLSSRELDKMIRKGKVLHKRFKKFSEKVRAYIEQSSSFPKNTVGGYISDHNPLTQNLDDIDSPKVEKNASWEDFEYLAGQDEDINETLEHINNSIIDFNDLSAGVSEEFKDTILTYSDKGIDAIITLRHELDNILNDKTLPNDILEVYDENLTRILEKLQKLTDLMYDRRLYVDKIQSLNSSLTYFKELNEDILIDLKKVVSEE